jgi:uncharacterized protein YjiS (DUF1127 family)
MQFNFHFAGDAISPPRGACAEQANRLLEASAATDREMPVAWFVTRCQHLHPLPPVDSAAGAYRAPEASTPPISPEPDPWWQSVPDALAWIVELLIEGFAAYGASMHPGFFELPGVDDEGRRELAETRWSGHSGLPPHDGETSRSDQWLDTLSYEMRESDLPPGEYRADAAADAAVDKRPRLYSLWRASIVTRFANLWLTVYPWRTATAELPELDTLDDRTLRDIGISRSEFGCSARPGERHEWNDQHLALRPPWLW